MPEISPHPANLPPANQEKPKRDPTIPLLAAITIFFFVIVVSAIAFGFYLMTHSQTNRRAKTPGTTPTPTPAVTPPPLQSRYASDSALLKMQSDLNALQNDINSVDLVEPQLAPPDLDLNIRIQH